MEEVVVVVEVINRRFDENRKRQGLTLSSTTRQLQHGEVVEVEGDDVQQGHPPDSIRIQKTPAVLPRNTPPEVEVTELTEGPFHRRDRHSPPGSTSRDRATGRAPAVVAEGDKSRKGSVDQRIFFLATLINSTDDFFTTSSCSGRIILFANEKEAEEHPSLASLSGGPSNRNKKKGCNWLLVSHDEVDEAQFLEIWAEASKTVTSEVNFKVEPAIFHIQCRKLSGAKSLLHAATESGFRNSGMVIGKENRITVAVRSAMSLDVPLMMTSALISPESLVTENYLKFLASKANEKMVENWTRLQKFAKEFSNILPSQ